jgi:Fe-S oxidoreductase
MMLSLMEKIIFVALLAVALWAALRELGHKAGLIRRGRPVDRLQHPLRRLWYALERVLLQIPVFRERPLTGLFHAFIFWGFFVFALVTLNHVAEGFSHGFSLYGHGLLAKLILFGANIFAALIILAVAYFLVRRYIVKAPGLDRPSPESLIILSFIFILMTSFVYYEAFRLYSAPLSRANFLAAFAHGLMPAQLDAGVIGGWSHGLWWLHILVIMAFGVFIMYSKHLHLIAGPVNLLLRNTESLADIPVVNLEEQEKFGTPAITDFTQKDLLDLFSCAECGRCEDVCPAWQSGKSLSPKKLLHDLKEHLLAEEPALKAGGEQKTLLDGVISSEVTWDCTTCAGCMTVCPMLNEHIAKITGLRQYAVMMASHFPEELQNLFRGLENQGNPWGLGAETRADWANDLNVPLITAKGGQADILLWVGCEGSYDAHCQKSTRAFVQILQKAGVDFAYLGSLERCCGDPARRAGHEYMYQVLAMQNIETLNQFKFNRIVTLCPHGYHVLQHEYAKLGGHYTVVHYSELLQELIAAGKITLAPQAERVTYHDPCYLGRYNHIYDAPRQVLAQTGAAVTEMAQHKRTSFCCGAGGGGMWKEEKTGERISHVRTAQAQATGAAKVVTACPYCSIMFKDAIAEKEIVGLENKDLAVLVWERMQA